MRKIYLFLMASVIFSGCLKHEYPNQNDYEQRLIKDNVVTVFGAEFSEDQDWCTTVRGEVLVENIPNDAKRVQLLAQIKENDGETSLKVLNEYDVNGEASIKIYYDAPKDIVGLFVSFITPSDFKVMAVKDGIVKYSEKATTRNDVSEYTLPTIIPEIIGHDKSFANEFGWVSNDGLLYYHNNYDSQKMRVNEYLEEYINTFNNVIFSYFQNGRKYNNLPLVKKSGYYNENAYPITTGDDPIIVSPVYKNDGGYKEIENCDLYYYYFKESDVTDDAVSFINSLPKYKLLSFKDCIKDDNVTSKHASYALIYWGENGGSYTFPRGYKIGFMVRSKYTGNQGDKRGELYGDGRLNNSVNAKKPFSSSKLGTDGPRVAWLTLNGKTMMCWESGTDTDFNDIILEVEGGIEPIIIIPELESNYYTYCFEDTQLGDYDMNDVVIKAKREGNKVEYSLVACGAHDELYIKNINGFEKEVHSLFNKGLEYINTENKNAEPKVVSMDVKSDFSFLDEDTQPYIINKTKGTEIRLSKKGEDPHGIMIPYDFKYPLEKICIKDAYSQFNSWGKMSITSNEWYKFPIENNVY